MKKRVLSFLLALLLVLPLSGCAEGSYSAGQQELQAFENLQLECAAAGVRIVRGESYAISWQVQGELSADLEGDTLVVKQHRPRAKYEDGDNYITLTLPQGASLQSVSLSSAAGEVVMEGLSVDMLRIVCAAGSVQLRYMAVGESELNVAAGNLYFGGSIGNTALVVSAGDAEMQLLGDPAHCYVDYSVAVGHLWLDERTAYSAEEAQYVIEADVAVGDFKLMFP